MNVVPHILLKKGDRIRIPQGAIDFIVEVVDIIEWKLLVEYNDNRFCVPWGFFLKDEGYYRPLIYTNVPENISDNGTT